MCYLCSRPFSLPAMCFTRHRPSVLRASASALVRWMDGWWKDGQLQFARCRPFPANWTIGREVRRGSPCVGWWERRVDLKLWVEQGGPKGFGPKMHLIVKIEEHLIRDSKMLPDQEYNQIVAFWFREPIFRHVSLASAVWIRRSRTRTWGRSKTRVSW